jgi:hypothetical protein
MCCEVIFAFHVFLNISCSLLQKINTFSFLQLDSATSLIQAAKNLMNAVVLTVKSSYVASTKYPRQGTISVSYSYLHVILCKLDCVRYLNSISNYIQVYQVTMSRDSVAILMTSLWARWSGVWIHAGARHFSFPQNIQTGSGAHLVSYSMGVGGVKLTAHLHVLLRLKMSGVITPLTLCAFIVYIGTTLPIFYQVKIKCFIVSSKCCVQLGSFYPYLKFLTVT